MKATKDWTCDFCEGAIPAGSTFFIKQGYFCHQDGECLPTPASIPQGDSMIPWGGYEANPAYGEQLNLF